MTTVSTNSFHFAKGCSKHVIGERKFFKGISKEDEVIFLTKKVENQLQKIIVALSVAIETNPESETKPSVITTFSIKTKMGRKTRDKPELK